MRVIATEEGFDGNVIRKPGEEFDMPDGSMNPSDREVFNEKTGGMVTVKGTKPTWFKATKPSKAAADLV